MSLVHPSAKSFERKGCLTPFFQDAKKDSEKLPSDGVISNTTTILSPPLSPFQHYEEEVDDKNCPVYLDTKSQFQVENFKPYELTFQPWNNLNSKYKRHQLNFLEQYSIVGSREKQEKRPIFKKRIIHSESDSDSTVDRIRTRKLVKENSDGFSEIQSNLDRVDNSPSKKRKVKKEASPYVPKPSLIDDNIPDLSPNVSTLPSNNRCLKVEWKGQPMDLRADPDVEKLHPAEALLASTLRLPANVYLDSKRRLFFEKVNRLKTGKQFRRTDAQKACRIDVNKASRLFAAFEKVGWLNDEHFQAHL